MSHLGLCSIEDYVAFMIMQGWEFTHSLISLKSNEQLWAIRSRQMSDCEQIAQVAQDKWAIRSKNVG